MINLFIVEDQQTILQILKSYLEQESDFKIVGMSTNGQAAIKKVGRLKPDVVLMDIEMPGIDGITATRTISELYPEVKVLILTTHDDNQVLNFALQAGAKGYILKTTPPKELIDFIRSVHQGNLQLDAGLVQKIPLKYQSLLGKKNTGGEKVASPFSVKSPYVLAGILLNSLVWLSVILYAKFAPAEYTSEWGMKILGTGNGGVELSLPTIGKASSDAKATQSNEDTVIDYVYIAADSSLIEQTAAEARMSVKEFGKPEIVSDGEGSIISLSIEGDTPAEAQKKAYAYHYALTKKIQKLREAEIERQEQHTQATLDQARQRLAAAQDRLSSYQVSSTLSSEEQIKQITNNLEELYRQKAELSAQNKGLDNFSRQLGEELNLSSSEATAAYQLLDDNAFQQQLQQYAQANRELTNLLSRFTTANPAVQEKQAQLQEVTTALQQRASFLLNRPIGKQELDKITYLTLNPKVKTVRQEVFKDLISNDAEAQKLAAQIRELENQMELLESRQKNVAQNQLKMSSFQRDVQVAEAIFATTLAQLDLGKENVYALYPPIQLIKEPSLPKENQPTSPNLRLLMLSGMAASFLLTTGLILLWLERRPSASPTSPKLKEKLPTFDLDEISADSESRQYTALNSKSER